MKILVIGDAMIDEYLFGEINRYSPEDLKVPIVDMTKDREQRLGGCLNVAANVAALGAEVSVSTILELINDIWLTKAGVNTTYSSDAKETLLKQRIIDNKTGKQVVRLDLGKEFSKEAIAAYKEFVDERTFLHEFDAVIVSDYQKGVVDEYWAQRLSNYNKPVFIDTKNPNLSLWRKIPQAYIKLNESEFYCADHRDNPHPIVVTVGGNGVELRSSAGFHITRYPAYRIENPNVVGAGDVFVSALAVEYTKNRDLSKAIEFANDAAAYSCTKKHTTVVSRKEVEEWVITRQ